MSIIQERMIAMRYTDRNLAMTLRHQGHDVHVSSVRRWRDGATPKDLGVRRAVIDVLKMSEKEALRWLAPKGEE